MLFDKKSDGALINFRQLNKATKFYSEPVRNPEYIYVKLNSKKFLTKLDFCKGYWQVPKKDSDKENTAFSTSCGLFHFKRMSFGLVNAGATYCQTMRKLLEGIPCVDSYVDDVLIHTSSRAEHLSILRQVFGCIKATNLTVKPLKCNVGEDSIGFIGHNVKFGFLHTQQDNVEKVMKADIPKNKNSNPSFPWISGILLPILAKLCKYIRPSN